MAEGSKLTAGEPKVPRVVPDRPIGVAHCRRLREVWRSAGWPCQDRIEVELLATGLLERLRDATGRETVRVTDAGLQVLNATLQKNRAARDTHEALVARVALEMQRAGRIVWRGLRLRAPPSLDGAKWTMAVPDVFSIRHTTVEDYVEPIVHEIKVRRADLLSDLRHDAKRAAYLGVSSQCWYVLKAGIGEADEIPLECGVLFSHDTALEVARPAPRRQMRVPLGVWMALARADTEPPVDDTAQSYLGADCHSSADPGSRFPALRDHAPAIPQPGHSPAAAPLVEHHLPHCMGHSPQESRDDADPT